MVQNVRKPFPATSFIKLAVNIALFINYNDNSKKDDARPENKDLHP
jgi:hypothetical protein